MEFNTLEEAMEHITKQTKEFNAIKQAKEGLETKLKEVEETNTKNIAEIDRLKIKNYEYFEQITTSSKDVDNSKKDEDKPINNTSINDVINSFK